MLYVRSAVFQLAFFGVLLSYMLACLPALVLPRRYARACIKSWARTNEWLLARICGLKLEIRGGRNLPPGGALVASKHQSAWETISFLHILPTPAMVLKKELLYLPFFGWYAMRAEHLWVDRSAGATALRGLMARARAALEQGRQIVIFPEGTRKAPGSAPDYRRGIVALYRDLKVPCVPVALNSGLYWKRRDWKRRPGTIIVEFCEPIPPGLDGKTFLKTLETRIETATNALVAEGSSPPPQ
ncbi:Acyl-CoA:1-acyl-sn-glycerol-3-phosphate acyltransferase [hydrothermal vent metagenome]|uniref:Acyl-CoA:1-acyl-sn-glycerol-3-phosphate acyltransferase n=1 Tax=hydrothermal vent metagenome TaxID=652676 RepID=A0A3B0TEH7_9ZZZZ